MIRSKFAVAAMTLLATGLVISGSLALGMGDQVNHKASKTLTAGGYGVAPANMHHFAWTKTGAVVQVNLMGPFAITYVNPADDPSHGK